MISWKEKVSRKSNYEHSSTTNESVQRNFIFSNASLIQLQAHIAYSSRYDNDYIYILLCKVCAWFAKEIFLHIANEGKLLSRIIVQCMPKKYKNIFS
jgi:hypothetical protein